MNFLLGISLILPLAFFTSVLWILSQKLPGEMALVLIAIMIFGDGLLAGAWYLGLQEIATDIKRFRLGLGFSFCFTSFGRAIYFMLKSSYEKM